ncbi:hypothetical protein GCM10011492_41040 [Flexivirga endophytica]|uniref:Uncharacterized protein n=1 Tax=Flexivirga endophytica TaxID=1849103 RepID=A0A916TKJ6_9MICO|nr:hypothetical protein [Flexivirga endophytica]GGB45706.1 hypothetical protein GCM10011492_41040 [Flexivirga endophytica]GHB66336.1 hypothetical protein GCM10008112_38950 [Flexivirga endophytica]
MNPTPRSSPPLHSSDSSRGPRTSAHTDETGIPEESLEALVQLVDTGPVPLGGYTLAEIYAVGGIAHLLEQEPDPALVAEAVRSLVARNLITTEAGSDELEIRGDLGIATALQHRASTVIDTRVTGSEPDHPWRFILMPQPDGVTLEVLIDALGIHFYSLRKTDDTYDRLWERLPSGDRGPDDADAESVLSASAYTALVSVSRWNDAGDRDTHDMVLAQEGERCHAFVRSADDPTTLVPAGMAEDEWRDAIKRLATVS